MSECFYICTSTANKIFLSDTSLTEIPFSRHTFSRHNRCGDINQHLLKNYSFFLKSGNQNRVLSRFLDFLSVIYSTVIKVNMPRNKSNKVINLTLLNVLLCSIFVILVLGPLSICCIFLKKSRLYGVKLCCVYVCAITQT